MGQTIPPPPHPKASPNLPESIEVSDFFSSVASVTLAEAATRAWCSCEWWHLGCIGWIWWWMSWWICWWIFLLLMRRRSMLQYKIYSTKTACKQIMKTSHRRTHTKQWVWSFHLFILPNLPTEKNHTKNLPGEFWTLASKEKNERKLFTWQLGERSLFGIKFTAWITLFNSDLYNGLL